MSKSLCIALLAAGLVGNLSAQVIRPIGRPQPIRYRHPENSIPSSPTLYVQTSSGVNVYNSSSGQLTQVVGSPFQTSGQLIGATGQYIVSLGSDYIHVYPLSGTGAISNQVSSIDTQSNAGSECGTVNYGAGGAVSNVAGGTFVYAQLFDDGAGNCAAWQSYQMAANGGFAFTGDVLGSSYSDGNADPTSNLTFDSSGQYAYAFAWNETSWQPGIVPFTAVNGNLQSNATFTEVDPTSDAGLDYFLVPSMAASDSSGHLAVLMSGWFYGDNGSSPENPQLASYTIDPATGSIVSANTQDDAPFTSIVSVNSLAMSTDGMYVAVGGFGGDETTDGDETDGSAAGLQIFNFNGAFPLTVLDSLLAGVIVDQVAWDNQGYLYALSSESGQLYVFQVTANGAIDVSGSPYAVENNGVMVLFSAN